MSSLTVRIISALIALPVAIALIHFNVWAFGALLLFVGGVCLLEIQGMCLPDDPLAQKIMTVIGLGMMALTLLGSMQGARTIAIFSVVLIGILMFFLFRTGDMTTVGSRMSLAFIGLVWAGGLLTVTGALRLLPHGEAWIYLACIIAWGSDTGGYFAGRFLGKRKLYEKVSPKKTWEGSIGGVVVSTLGAAIFVEVYGAPRIELVHLVILVPIVAACGQIGDLAESLLKRSTGVKDSGTIMPGHGGLLDRVDALIFVGPILFAYAVLVLQQRPAWLMW